MMVEMFDGALPWRSERDTEKEMAKEMAAELKAECLQDPSLLTSGAHCPGMHMLPVEHTLLTGAVAPDSFLQSSQLTDRGGGVSVVNTECLAQAQKRLRNTQKDLLAMQRLFNKSPAIWSLSALSPNRITHFCGLVLPHQKPGKLSAAKGNSLRSSCQVGLCTQKFRDFCLSSQPCAFCMPNHLLDATCVTCTQLQIL